VDFSNDYEFHVLVSGKHDATGLEYGAHMEFEGDTNHTEQTDEEWLWLRGGFGEFRFGDDDGVVDDDSIGAYTIAANTGGLDGDVISQISISAVRPSNTGDSTKVKYHSPSFGGLQVGVSFTPNDAVLNSGVDQGDSISARDVAVSNEVEGSLVYKGDFAGLGVQASVVGSWGHVATPALVGGPGSNNDKYWTYYGGFATTIFGFKLGAGAGNEDVGGLKRKYANAGVGASYGPVNVSLTAGKVFDSSGYVADKPWMAVLGADVGLMPGLVLGGELAYFDNDLPSSAQNAGDDKGWSWLADLRLAF
jgi:predicted porin